MGGNKRISLCGQLGHLSNSEDDRDVPSRDASAFGSMESEEHGVGEQPSTVCLSDAAAAAAGNSLSGRPHPKRSPDHVS